MKLGINFDNFKVNKLVKYFILSDLFLVAGIGLIAPIFAIFIVDRIEGATVVTVGIAAAVYWIIKSLVQLPIAVYLDKTGGERDEFYTFIGGLLLVAAVAVGFIFISKVWHLFLLQAFNAVAFAMYTPSWSGIFSRHLDKDKPAFEWTLDSTVLGFAYGITGAIGGILASQFGFNVIFLCSAALGFVAAVIIFFSPDIVFPKPSLANPLIRDHKPYTTSH